MECDNSVDLSDSIFTRIEFELMKSVARDLPLNLRRIEDVFSRSVGLLRVK